MDRHVSPSASSRIGEDDGYEHERLPLHYSPPPDGLRTWEGGRSEYLEITRERVLPKVMQLAQRLVPAAAMEVERGGWLSSNTAKKDDEGNGNSEEHDDFAGTIKTDKAAAGLKTTGLDDSGVDVESGLCLPQNAAMAASNLAFPDSGDATFVDIVPVVPVDAITAELDSDVALMDIEADALLASIRSNSPQDNGSADEENRSIASFETIDDDEMGEEMRRLGQVVASLRQDLAVANLCDPPLDSDSGTGRSSERPTGGQSYSPTSYLQTWKYFGLRNDEATGSKTAALAWAIALLWALVILLSGHIKLGSGLSGGPENSWADMLGWLFS